MPAEEADLLKAAAESEPAKPCIDSAGGCAGVFSIDLEDFSQLECREATGILPDVSADLDRQMEVVLATLAEFDVRATFFVLGMIASQRPDIVRRVHDAGHEIASHGMQHIQVFRQTREQFAADVRDSVRVLEDLTGRPVLGYRAPCFSIISETVWALDVLAELGLRYDSSVFPVRIRRYGIPGFDPLPRLYRLGDEMRMVEIPVTVWQRGRRRIPIAGGGYLRVIPRRLLRTALDAVDRAGCCFALYLHPYEFDPRPLDVARALPRDRSMSRFKRVLLNAKCNFRRGTILEKVRWLCERVRFGTYADLAQRLLQSGEERELPDVVCGSRDSASDRARGSQGGD